MSVDSTEPKPEEPAAAFDGWPTPTPEVLRLVERPPMWDALASPSVESEVHSWALE